MRRPEPSPRSHADHRPRGKRSQRARRRAHTASRPQHAEQPREGGGQRAESSSCGGLSRHRAHMRIMGQGARRPGPRPVAPAAHRGQGGQGGDRAERGGGQRRPASLERLRGSRQSRTHAGAARAANELAKARAQARPLAARQGPRSYVRVTRPPRPAARTLSRPRVPAQAKAASPLNAPSTSPSAAAASEPRRLATQPSR